MSRTKYLNAYHRASAKRMKLAAIRRSKQPPMSPGEFMAQVLRLASISADQRSRV